MGAPGSIPAGPERDLPMFELLVCIAAIGAMVKIADADDRSPWMWGAITFLLVVASVVLVPWPFIRVGIAFGLAAVGMIAYKVVRNR